MVKSAPSMPMMDRFMDAMLTTEPSTATKSSYTIRVYLKPNVYMEEDWPVQKVQLRTGGAEFNLLPAAKNMSAPQHAFEFEGKIDNLQKFFDDPSSFLPDHVPVIEADDIIILTTKDDTGNEIQMSRIATIVTFKQIERAPGVKTYRYALDVVEQIHRTIPKAN